MINRFFATLVILSLHPILFGQQNTVSGGGYAYSTAGTVNFTIGQTCFQNTTNISADLNDGVQQPYEFFTLGFSPILSFKSEILVYPNPTQSLFYISLLFEEVENIFVKVYTADGKIIYDLQLLQKVTEISLDAFPQGIYFVEVFGLPTATTYKIIKN